MRKMMKNHKIQNQLLFTDSSSVYPPFMNYQHYRHFQSPIVSIMSIIHGNKNHNFADNFLMKVPENFS